MISHLRSFAAATLVGLCFASALFAQAPEPGQPADNGTGAPAPAPAPGAALTDDEIQTLTRRTESHRIRIGGGIGYGDVLAGVLSESAPAWELNSFIRAGQVENYQPNLAILRPEAPTKMVMLHADFQYAFRDRIFVNFEYSSLDHDYDRDDANKATFVAPANDQFQRTLFEGMSLVRYREIRRAVDLMYLHPVLFKGLKVGVFAGREWYYEQNDISFGSLTATGASASPAGLLRWSFGAITPSEYRMSGFIWGPAIRYQLFDWLGVLYRFTPVYQRKGTMNLSGIQNLNQIPASGDATFAPLVPVHYGEATDRGVRHNLEAIIRIYCRYGLHIGLLREDFKRSYQTYYGATFSPFDATGYAAKTWGYGFGEGSQSFKISKFEIYMKMSASFFF